MLVRQIGWLVALAGIACTGSDRPEDTPHDDGAGESGQAIVGGTLDTSHQAVVAWLHGSKCSATIVHVSGSTGYALTAAHCVGGPLGDLHQGNNHNSPTVSYPVTDATVHPEYAASNAYDFAMLTFSGATSATPVIPVLPLAMDNINLGTVEELVGYGLTQNGATSQRHHIDRPVAFESPLWLAWNQQSGGVCSGDSGGPALHSAGQEYVAAVHSFVSSSSCDGTGVSVRASAVLSTFVEPYIADTPFLQQSCGQCFDAHTKQGACVDEIDDCFSNAGCESYADCLQGCTHNACVVQCGLDHSAGKALYDAIYACGCDTACSDECAGDAMCEPDPVCWLKVSDPGCQSCLDGGCCAEATACAADAMCLDCVSDPTPNPNCGNDPELVALSSCLENQCGSACDVTSTGEGGGGEGGAAVGVGGGESIGAGGSSPASGGTSIDQGDEVVIDGGCAIGARPGSPWAGAAWALIVAIVSPWRRRRR